METNHEHDWLAEDTNHGRDGLTVLWKCMKCEKMAATLAPFPPEGGAVDRTGEYTFPGNHMHMTVQCKKCRKEIQVPFEEPENEYGYGCWDCLL